MAKKKFSDLPATTSIGASDLLATSQVDADAQSGYTSKKITGGNVARSINAGIEYPTDLETEDKTIIGAINEINSKALAIDSASGDIASFDTAISAPLVSLSTTIVAKGGGGTPSTPIPIVGYSEVNFTNEDDNHTELDSIIIQLGQTVYGGYITKNVNGNWVLTVTSKCVDMGDLNWTFHASGSTAYNYFSTILDNVKFVQPLTVANAICSMFPFVTSEQVAKTGYDETIAIGGITCFVAYDHYTDVGQFITAVTGQKLVFELATPFTIDLSSSDMLDAVVGKNNVFSDCGVTTARYKDSIQHYIDTRI